MRQLLGMAVTVVLLAGVRPLEAQGAERHGSAPPPPAPVARPRIAYAADAPPPPAPIRAAAPAFLFVPGGYIVTGPAYLVLSDGSVLVDFGNGYERVLRSCAQPNRSEVQVNQNGRDALGRILDPPGIAALRAGTRGQAMGSVPAPNANACFRNDMLGRVEMVSRGWEQP